ncbi:MAG: hypothetical protein IJO64_05065 [Clostridia bacterium]|nr:hypothetical protein [Clostridia bacterium]
MKTNLSKRLVGLLLAAMMMLSIVPFAASAEGAACEICGEAYANGFCPTADCTGAYQPAVLNGDVYEISNAGQLYWFAALVNGKLEGVEQNLSANAILLNDITVNTGVLASDGNANSGDFRIWTPIAYTGDGTNIHYTGTFNGNNKCVSGLYRNSYYESSNYEGYNIAFIGQTMSSAVIKDLTIKDSYFAGYDHVGGIVGWAGGNTTSSVTVTNCVNEASVKGWQNVGGIVGDANYGTYTNCINKGTVFVNNMAGGIIGNISYNSAFTGCVNYGNIVKINTRNGQIGGFVGYVSAATPTFNKCGNDGDLIFDQKLSAGSYIGGFAGYVLNGSMTNCYSTGDLIMNQGYAVSGTHYYGGFAGRLTNSSVMENCYVTGEIISTVTTNTTNIYIGTVAGSVYSKCTLNNIYYLPDGYVNSSGTAKTYAAVEKNSTTYTPVEITAEQISNGELCYLLNKGVTDGTQPFYQDLGDDNNPNFNTKTVDKLETSEYSGYVNQEAIITLGAKINTDTSSLRMGAYYTADWIEGEKTSENITDMGIVFYPVHLLGKNELSLKTEGALKQSATGIVEYDASKVFVDYEAFTFFTTITNIPEKGLDTEIAFRGYVVYDDGTVFFSDTLARSYNYVAGRV